MVDTRAPEWHSSRHARPKGDPRRRARTVAGLQPAGTPPSPACGARTAPARAAALQAAAAATPVMDVTQQFNPTPKGTIPTTTSNCNGRIASRKNRDAYAGVSHACIPTPKENDQGHSNRKVEEGKAPLTTTGGSDSGSGGGALARRCALLYRKTSPWRSLSSCSRTPAC
jgi:hypothetical protein